jgi:hypothetical protein
MVNRTYFKIKILEEEVKEMIEVGAMGMTGSKAKA